MPAIDRPGLYRGPILEHNVGRTRKAGLPQFVATLQAIEVYNDITGDWENWDYDQTITGYFVLATLNDNEIPIKCFPRDYVMDATGWDGVTYAGLEAMDVTGKPVQFRVIENTYRREGEAQDSLKMKVSLIAAENADIGLRKLSKTEVADLDIKFGIASTSAKPKTAATPAKKKATPKSQAPKPVAPKPPKATPPKIERSAESTEPCTEEAAYQACLSANAALAKPVPGKVMDDYWVDNVTKIAADQNNVTNEEWPKIRNATLKDIDIPF